MAKTNKKLIRLGLYQYGEKLEAGNQDSRVSFLHVTRPLVTQQNEK